MPNWISRLTPRALLARAAPSVNWRVNVITFDLRARAQSLHGYRVHCALDTVLGFHTRDKEFSDSQGGGTDAAMSKLRSHLACLIDPATGKSRSCESWGVKKPYQREGSERWSFVWGLRGQFWIFPSQLRTPSWKPRRKSAKIWRQVCSF